MAPGVRPKHFLCKITIYTTAQTRVKRQNCRRRGGTWRKWRRHFRRGALENSSLRISGGKQVENLLNGVIGWSVMEQRVGQRSTDALVKQDEHERGGPPKAR